MTQDSIAEAEATLEDTGSKIGVERGGQIVKESKDAHAIAQALAERNRAMLHDAAAIQVKPPPHRIPP